MDKVAAAREFRVLQAALHTSTAYRDSVGRLDPHTDSLLTVSVSAAVSGSLGMYSSVYSFQVFKMLNNKESLDQIIVATPGLSSDPVALGMFILQAGVICDVRSVEDLLMFFWLYF